METATETIANLNPARRRWPPWLRFVVGFWVPVWAVVEAVGLALQTPGNAWFPWFWTAYLFFFALAVWASSITWMQVGPERVIVHRPLRSQIASLADILEVGARRQRWSVRPRGQPPDYQIDVMLTSGRHWRLDLIEPVAGDRLLATLQRFKKPIMVFPMPRPHKAF